MFHLSLQFTLEDARERLNSLHQGSGSPASDRRQLAASRLDPASVREQRHSIHVLTSSSPTPASHGEYYSLIILIWTSSFLCKYRVKFTEPSTIYEQE